MKFSRPEADIFCPDGSDPSAALARTTHLCVAAHQDDIEIMAHDAIAECYGSKELFFTGVVGTDGAGSPRAGSYANLTDEQMKGVRREEQRKAAQIGRYNLQIQLAHPSSEVKIPRRPSVASDLAAIFGAARPQVVYLHSPADKHDTHVALLLRCIEALRKLPPQKRPLKVLGCEVWRDLDWMVDTDKIALNSGLRPDLAEPLLKVFDSQISGGKRYDLAALGRRAANATFNTSHKTDAFAGITWAMDLTPLLRDDGLSVSDLALAHVERLKTDISSRISKYSG